MTAHTKDFANLPHYDFLTFAPPFSNVMNTRKQIASIALALDPQELYNQNSFINLLHIYKTDKSIDYEQYPLDEPAVKRHFKNQPADIQNLLCRFNDDDLKFEAGQIRKKRAKERSGIAVDTFTEKALMRYMLELTEQLLPVSGSMKYYHRIINPKTGNKLTAPCRLNSSRPNLKFEVIRDEAGLGIHAFLLTGEEVLPLTAFRRNKFLVEKDHEYFLLHHTDYITLEWLANSQPAQYAGNPTLLAQRIVQKLEETHSVNRNDLFPKTEIRTAPVSCLYLSEISGSMLMLTPKWKYDGILVDGEWKENHETVRNGEAYTIYRSREQEQHLMTLVQSLHASFQRQPATFYYLPFAEAGKKQWFLKAYHHLLAQDVELIGLELLQHFRYSPFAVTTTLTIKKQEGNTQYLYMKVCFGKEEALLTELQKLLLAGQHSILLKDNSIGVLTDEWLEEYAVLLKHGKITKNEIVVPQWIFMSLQQGDTRSLIATGIREDWVERWKDWQAEKEIVYPAPVSLQAALRPYQQKGYEWMRLLSETGAGACLADDMGLGKTLQTIAFLLSRHETHPHSKSLIVCPASLIYNWKQEFEKFAPAIKTGIHNGALRSTTDFFSGSQEVMICSYGTLRSDIEELKIYNWNVAVLDESHNIKNVSSLTTKAVTQLQAQCRVGLSGTPVMNNTFDLYAQLDFLLPGLFSGQDFFRRQYAIPIDRDQNQEQIVALQQLTAPFILRRTKKQVATDLPEKTESILWCEMAENQREVYNEVKEQIRDSIYLDIKNTGFGQSKIGILAGIQKLRQACASPLLLDKDATCRDSVKIDLLLEELQHIKESKALVFSQFKGMLHLIAAALTERAIPFYHFDGDTPIAERSELVRRFQQPEDTTPLFLISLKAGNTGLNLTAAEYVFLVDPWWNTAVQQQAIDRTHRIGQTKNVFAYKMICKDTIEEKIVAMQERKKHLSDELIGEENGFVKNLTEDDLAFLFS